MKWFKKISLANKLAVITIVIGAITLAITVLATQKSNEKPNFEQSSIGDNSPVINTDRDVNINF